MPLEIKSHVTTEGHQCDFASVLTSECLTPPLDTTQPPPHAEQPTERTAWSGARPGE